MSIETAKGAPVSSKPVTLYGFHKQPKSPSGSAFCQKLETYYRFSNIPYIDEGTTPNTAPKGKLPYVKYEDGTFRADSHLIIRHEVEKGGPELDSMCGLTDLEKADGAVYRGYWEDHVYPSIIYTRWMVPENYQNFIEDQMRDFPWIKKKLISNLAYYGVRSSLNGHGVGRHSLEEVESLLKISFNALEVKMRENQKDGGDWFFGKKGPAEIDATLYGVLASTAITPSTPLVNRLVAGSSTLSKYVLNITEKYFPEYGQLINGLKKNLNIAEEAI